MYAIIDVETTGLSPHSEKITEIAILIHNGKKVTEEFVTLIDPEKKIPYRITQLTGINNKTVEGAPRFYEVAKKIIEVTENRIMVGHNVAFDYNFIRSEFKNLGYDFKIERLCTVKMSRKLIPLQRSYGLGNLCKELNIDNPSRHRASGDATATAKLFELLLSIDPAITGISLKGLNSNLSNEKIKELPQKPGVYYFFNKQGDIIYIGKSINIRNRVLSHISNNTSKKEIELKNCMTDVDYELTGNELTALLLESAEIKRNKPLFNRAQLRTVFTYGLYSYQNSDGYMCLKIDKNKEKNLPLTTFTNQLSAKEFLFNLVEEHGLCQKLCGLYKTQHACFHYHIKQCNGACIGKETPDNYNLRVEESIKPYKFDQSNFIIIDRGRTNEERALVAVKNGKYVGFGFVNTTLISNNIDFLMGSITPYPDNKDAQQIIRNYLRKNEMVRIINF
ncbi:MAG: GIY-YIG nuclease family protein [Bacteroidales bacterium]|nr:GIY-YIG nuclease family protein [Bacteroidales bacterium]